MAGNYLFEAFLETGMFSTGMSISPLSWSEIQAYAALTKIVTEPHEARLIKQMSEAYLEGYHEGSGDALSSPPWDGALVEY